MNNRSVAATGDTSKVNFDGTLGRYVALVAARADRTSARTRFELELRPTVNCEHVLPADNLKFIKKVAETPDKPGKDGKRVLQVLLDLEDAVAPTNKNAAVPILIEALNTINWGGKVVNYRPNNTRTEWNPRDLIEVIFNAGQNIDGIMVPKVFGPDELVEVRRVVQSIERHMGWPEGRIKVMCLIELAESMVRTPDIGKVVHGFSFGVADYTADVHGHPSAQEEQFTHHIGPKKRVTGVARANGITAIDCITLNVKSRDITREDALKSAEVGFNAKWSLHPTQIDAIQEDDIEWPASVYTREARPLEFKDSEYLTLEKLAELASASKPLVEPEKVTPRHQIARRGAYIYKSGDDFAALAGADVLYFDFADRAKAKEFAESADYKGQKISLRVASGDAAHTLDQGDDIIKMLRPCLDASLLSGVVPAKARALMFSNSEATSGLLYFLPKPNVKAIQDRAQSGMSGSQLKKLQALWDEAIARSSKKLGTALDSISVGAVTSHADLAYWESVLEDLPNVYLEAQVNEPLGVDAMRAIVDGSKAKSDRLTTLELNTPVSHALDEAGYELRGNFLAVARYGNLDALEHFSAGATLADVKDRTITGLDGGVTRSLEVLPTLIQGFSPTALEIARGIDVAVQYRIADERDHKGAIAYKDYRNVTFKKGNPKDEITDAATVKIDLARLALAYSANLMTRQQRWIYENFIRPYYNHMGESQPLENNPYANDYDIGARFVGQPVLVTDAMVHAFAKLSDDRNNYHLDQAYADASRYKGRIVHGILSTGITLSSFQAPGPDYGLQSLKILGYTAAVPIGTAVIPEATIIARDDSKNKMFPAYTMRLVARNDKGAMIFMAEAVFEHAEGTYPDLFTPAAVEYQGQPSEDVLNPFSKDVQPFTPRSAQQHTVGQQWTREVQLGLDEFVAAEVLFGISPYQNGLMAMSLIAGSSANHVPGYILIGSTLTHAGEISPSDKITMTSTVTAVKTTSEGKRIVDVEMVGTNKYGVVVKGSVSKIEDR